MYMYFKKLKRTLMVAAVMVKFAKHIYLHTQAPTHYTREVYKKNDEPKDN